MDVSLSQVSLPMAKGRSWIPGIEVNPFFRFKQCQSSDKAPGNCYIMHVHAVCRARAPGQRVSIYNTLRLTQKPLTWTSDDGFEQKHFTAQ